MPSTITKNVYAIFNTRHYGYFSDLIKGPENTKLKSLKRYRVEPPHLKSPIKVNSFGSDIDNPVEPEQTMCSNLDEYSRIFEPYVDYSLSIQLEPDPNRREAIEGFVYAPVTTLKLPKTLRKG